jgi:hypothetical protein
MDGQTCAPMAAKYAGFWVTEAAVEPLGITAGIADALSKNEAGHSSF